VRVATILSPTADWQAISRAAAVADEEGIDAVGFWDHYHSAQPEHGYVCGWSAYGAIAAATSRVRLVPMVLNALHYEVGVLAKEASILSLVSAGRFELGIGAGDWPESFAAWGRPYPDGRTRLDSLEETVVALRRLWTGEAVQLEGEHVRLSGARCIPAPQSPPRVVVGVGSSARTLERALGFADEVNVYDEPGAVERALERAAGASGHVDVSLFVDWSWDAWPTDPAAELRGYARRGIGRVFVSIGADDMDDRVRRLAAA
jgi:alkanesulfonate monooxygenase SsuD/methylene tetrahydromethanopterin reductase-like flavin-dependent oxidoreductase (luciferase family)